jgi:nucleoid-associated protein YgaU
MSGPAPTRPIPRRSGVAIDVGKGLLATASIITVLVGLPWLLVSVIGMPIGDLIADLTDPLSSDNARAAAALRLGLSAVVWLAWLQVAWALMVELVAAVLGRAAARSKLVVPAVQRSARNLVAAAMLLFTTFTAPASAATLAGLQPASLRTADATTVGPASFTELRSRSGDHIGPDLADGGGVEGFVDPGSLVDSEVTSGRVAADSATAGGIPRSDAADRGPRLHRASDPTARYTVGPGDTLWSIAEATTGDGFAWRTIRDQNLGRMMSDGSPVTPATETVPPGTVLLVPGSGTGELVDDGPTSPAPVEGHVMVESGDHFWALAEETLAAGWGRNPTDAEITPYWSDMIELNRDRLPPPGDPDLIHPGQQFLTPPLPGDPRMTTTSADATDSKPEADPPPATRPEAGMAAGSSSGTVPYPTTVAPSSPTASVTAGSSVTTSPGTEPDAPMPSSAVGVPQTYSAPEEAGGSGEGSGDRGNSGDQPRPDDETVPLAVVAITGLGLLTAAVARIIRRRQSQSMGSRPAGRSPDFSPPAMADQLLATTADENALNDLDRALRLVAAELEQVDLAVPELVGALVDASSVRLLLDSRHDAAPAPFRSGRDGMVWTADRPVPDGDGARAQGPFPALVTMGHTDEAQLLVDLEYVGVMNLNGGLADVIDTMGTMAFELATSPLADTIELVCVGFGEELGELERVTVVSTVEAVIERVEAHSRAIADLVADSELNGPQGRVSSVGDWTPLVVFDPLSDLSPASERLLAAVGRTAVGGVSAVVTTSGPDALTVELNDKELSIPAYDVRLSRRVLTRAQRAELAAALADATDPRTVEQLDLTALVLDAEQRAPKSGEPVASAGSPRPPGEDGVRTEPEPSSTHDHAATIVDHPTVVVRVMGPLRVETGDGALVVFDRSATPEFLAYLTHHRRGVGVDEAMNTLWPATTARRTWISNVHADARRKLAEVVGDEAAPRAGADDRYRLSELVASDLELFRRGVEAAVDLPVERAVEVLVGALELVEGIPYTNVTNRWPTSEGHWQEATMLVDEAARCVATLALDQLDDPRLAGWAAAKGLLASPHSVALHRLRLQSAMADGGDELGPDAVFQHYQATVLADEHRPEGGARLDPAIVELYESYRRSRMGVGADGA